MLAGEKPEGVIPTVSGSASLKDNTMFITLTNSNAGQAADVSVNLIGGAKMEAAEGRILCGEIHAHNTFEAPAQVVPHPFKVDCKATQLNLTLPAAAVATIKVQLLGKNRS